MITEMLPKKQINEIPPTIWNINGYTQYLNFNTDDENPNLTDIRGTAIYIKREIITSEVKINESSYKDHIWVETHLEGNEKILIGCIYRSPTGEKEETIKSLKCIEQIISITANMKYSRLLIAGDFNLKGIDWEDDFAECNRKYLQDFINTLHESFLYQHVKKPTRHRLGEKSNILDLVITNEEGIVSDIEHLPGLGKSDHECLLFNINCMKRTDKTNVKHYNVFKAKYTVIEKNLD